MNSLLSFFGDSLVMTRRNLLRLFRTPQVLVFSTIQPILFVILFDSVFGGSITPPGFENYIDFLVPGIMVQTAMFASINTGVGVAEDLEKGAIDRFRSLPMARTAVLFGRTNADGFRTLFVMTIVICIGFLVGFRPTTGILNLLTGLALAVLFANAIQWAFVFLALMLRSLEAVQAASFAPTFPLVFAASTFAPVQNMPSWLKGFAEHQPVTVTVDSVRGLFFGSEVLEASGGSLSSSILMSLAWIALIFAVFVSLSSWRFRRN